jgi:predicted nucleic acid-binding protein
MALPIFDAAMAINAARGFSCWDCAILAAAQALGCDEVLTEDMQHGQIVNGMRIVDPFR